MLTPEQVNALIDLGIAGLLIVGGFREWYVWGPAHRRRVAELTRDRDEVTRDRDFWRTQALRGTALSERALHALVGNGDEESSADG